MTNQEYIDLMDEGIGINTDIKIEAEGDPEVPPTKDQELIRKLRDWIDRILVVIDEH